MILKNSKTHRTKLIKQLAKNHGFLHVSIAKAEQMEPEAMRLESWLNKGRQGTMSYMENHFEKRTDPTLLVPGAKAVVSLAYNYFTEQSQTDPTAPKISKYAYGKDYHKVVRKKLKHLVHDLQAEIGVFDGRCFVDSAPVLERDWARRSGLGWIGKNTMLINPKMGSFFFLAELICDLELDYDHPITDYCGTCTKCIEACPTDAIDEKGYTMDGSKCISYLTIEKKDLIPTEFSDKMEHWMFGCDICQDVCPWNRFSSQHQESKFKPKEELLQMSQSDWQEITEEVFDILFEGSPVKRTKFEGLKRNIDFLYKD